MVKRLLKQAYERIPFKRVLFKAIRPMRPPEQLYRHLHFKGPFYVAVDEFRGFTIEHLGTIVENELFWSGLGGNWEPQSNRIWTQLCDGQAGVILDIGANTGVYSLIAAAVADQSASIIAFEPLARVAEVLRRNVALNGGQIQIEEIALSDHDGASVIHDFPDEVSYSASLERAFPGATRQYEVRTARLDSLLRKAPDQPIVACKIDVEGHEPAVLSGMAEALRRHAPPLLIEVLDGETGMRIGKMIEGIGYSLWNIDERNGLIPAKQLQPLGGENWNMLLCRQDDFDARGIERFLAR